MALKTENPDAVVQRAIDLYHEGNADDAIALLREAVRRFRSSAKLWGYLGFLQKERGSFKEAANCFQHAVQISPASEQASLGLFFSLYRAGKTRHAIDEMLRYLQCGRPREYVQLLRQAMTGGLGGPPIPPPIQRYELRLPPSPPTTRRSRARWARDFYVREIAKRGIALIHRKGSSDAWFLSAAGKPVAIPYASEGRSQDWWLGVPGKLMSERPMVVLLCEKRGGALLDFILSRTFIAEIRARLSSDSANAQVKINVRQRGHRYLLLLPQGTEQDITATRGSWTGVE